MRSCARLVGKACACCRDMQNYSLIDAVRAFQRELRAATTDDLNKTLQRIANEAFDGDLGQVIDSRQGICTAIAAEEARRAFDMRDDHEE